MDISNQLLLKDQIQERLFLYCKAIDQKEWDLLRSCFTDDHVHIHGSFESDANEFVEYAGGALGKYAFTQHSLSNIIIDISSDGKSANSECNFSAMHRAHHSDEIPTMDMLVQGQYRDRLIFSNGLWL